MTRIDRVKLVNSLRPGNNPAETQTLATLPSTPPSVPFPPPPSVLFSLSLSLSLGLQIDDAASLTSPTSPSVADPSFPSPGHPPFRHPYCPSRSPSSSCSKSSEPPNLTGERCSAAQQPRCRGRMARWRVRASMRAAPLSWPDPGGAWPRVCGGFAPRRPGLSGNQGGDGDGVGGILGRPSSTSRCGEGSVVWLEEGTAVFIIPHPGS